MHKIVTDLDLSLQLTVTAGQPAEWSLSWPDDIGSWSEVWVEVTDLRCGERRLVVSRTGGLILLNEHSVTDFHHGRLTVEDTTTISSDTPPAGDSSGVVIGVHLDSEATARLPSSDESWNCETYVRNSRGHLRCLDRRPLVVLG